MSLYTIFAILAYGLLVCGLLLRRIRKWHILCMLSGILIDLSIVLLLQMKRDAIHTALGYTLTPLQRIHVICSSLAVLFYVPAVTLGALRIAKQLGPGGRRWHIRCGLIAFFFRTLGLFFMFSVLS